MKPKHQEFIPEIVLTASPPFPSARYFQVHFEHLYELIQDLSDKLEATRDELALLRNKSVDQIEAPLKPYQAHHLSVYCKLLPVENITKMRTDGVGWDRSRNWRKK